MRSLIYIPAVLILAAIPLAACQSTSPGASADTQNIERFAQSRTATMLVKGMTCPFCASNLEEYLLKLDGVEKVDASLGSGRVIVQMTSFRTDTEATLRKAVSESGFTVDRFESTKEPK